MEFDFLSSLGFCLILFLIVSAAWVFFVKDDSSGLSFCERQGYDGVAWIEGGSYSQYYGKIKCRASFSGDRIIKTFDVTRKFGRFYEDAIN